MQEPHSKLKSFPNLIYNSNVQLACSIIALISVILLIIGLFLISSKPISIASATVALISEGIVLAGT